MSIQRGRPRIRDDDPSDPNRGNAEILRQRQRARLRREREREQRARTAKLAAECEQLRRAHQNMRVELAAKRQELTMMKEAFDRAQFDNICRQMEIDDLRAQLERTNSAPYEQVFQQI
uniref:BZIP domain-containing protein n=1 Tax=Steinernema glaseri TaxID=37863 RepID=A0A1I7YDN1_9BILA